MEERREIDVEL
jgi:hypothetical protein